MEGEWRRREGKERERGGRGNVCPPF